VPVDSGLFWGSCTVAALNCEPLTFDPRRLDAVPLTRSDYCGLLPRLVADGDKRSIWCTALTRDFLHQVLPDAGRIPEGEAERRNRRTDQCD
jgi:metallo-beta-lactamase family protein